jgi:hypothetical protein
MGSVYTPVLKALGRTHPDSQDQDFSIDIRQEHGDPRLHSICSSRTAEAGRKSNEQFCNLDGEQL